MDTVKLRKQLHEYIDHADNRVLNMIYAMLEADNTLVVAHTADGKPLTIEEYNKELEKAELQRAEEKVFTHDEVKNRVSQWRKSK